MIGDRPEPVGWAWVIDRLRSPRPLERHELRFLPVGYSAIHHELARAVNDGSFNPADPASVAYWNKRAEEASKFKYNLTGGPL